MPNAGNLYIGSESLTVKLAEKSSGEKCGDRLPVHLISKMR